MRKRIKKSEQKNSQKQKVAEHLYNPFLVGQCFIVNGVLKGATSQSLNNLTNLPQSSTYVGLF